MHVHIHGKHIQTDSIINININTNINITININSKHYYYFLVFSIFAVRVSREGKAIGSVRVSVRPSIRLSVCLFPLHLLNRLTTEFDFIVFL